MTENTHKPYDALLRSIDFFSQNLHLEQITQYGFKLFEDLVQPTQAVLYLKDTDQYTPHYSRGYDFEMPHIPYQKSHSDFAVFSGFILEHRSTMERFFSTQTLDLFDVEYVMPLISGNQLMGFVFYKGSEKKPAPDIAFMTRFNHLLNLSLEKACRFLESQAMKDEIDKRLFNLASLSQTTKLLLSEHETDKIYDLCIDVIRELTSSSVTSFSTIDPVSGHLITRAYKNIIHFDKKFFRFELKPNYPLPMQVIYNLEKDYAALESIFSNPNAFKEAGAQYVVLLITDKIMGCITIGEPVGAVNYDKSLLSQIENVAGLMHLSLTNAKQFEQILEQKRFMERQANLLKKINRSVKTINSAETLDELCQVSMDTLQFAFGVEAGFFAVLDQGEIEIMAPLGFERSDLESICQKQLRFQINHDLVVSYTRPELSDYFCESLVHNLPESNCLVIAPIRTTAWQSDPLGCIVVLRLSSPLHEEHTILIDSLADSVAPVIKQFYEIETLKKTHIPDPEAQVKTYYEAYESDKSDFGIEYDVYFKHVEALPFSNVNLSHYEGYDYVQVMDVIVVFSSEAIAQTLYDRSIVPSHFNDIVDTTQAVHLNEPVHSHIDIERMR